MSLTQGHWWFDKRVGGGWGVWAEDVVPGMSLANVKEKEDAGLMAAAPELLEALENALVDPSAPLRPSQIKMISSAIAKAKGEA